MTAQAKYILDGTAYRKISGGPEYPATMPLTIRTMDMRVVDGQRLATEEEIAPPPVRQRRRWEDFTGPGLARMEKDEPAKYTALLADRIFRRELGVIALTDEQIVAALNKRKALDAVAEFMRLREACKH